MVRNFESKDYSEIVSWWKSANELHPPETAMPKESSFVIEINNSLVCAITVYLTNTKEVAYLENFVANPEYKGLVRKEFTQELLDYANSFAKSLGYKRTMIISYKEKVKNRYKELGMIPTISNVTCFVKEL